MAPRLIGNLCTSASYRTYYKQKFLFFTWDMALALLNNTIHSSQSFKEGIMVELRN
jgi:hypothetical protein